MGSPVWAATQRTVITHEDERQSSAWISSGHWVTTSALRLGHELMTTTGHYYPGPTRSIYTAYGGQSTQVLDN